MTLAVLLIALTSGGLLALLLGLALVWGRFRIWPPEERGNWQFHISFGLFRVYCGAVVVFALLDWGSLGWDHWTRGAIGFPLLAIGSVLTLRGYLRAGLRNTYCEADGLVTRGLYAYSRNPQYVASVVATFGLAVVTDSWLTLFLAGRVVPDLPALRAERGAMAAPGLRPGLRGLRCQRAPLSGRAVLPARQSRPLRAPCDGRA